MRRRPGIHGLQQQQLREQKYRMLGQQVQEANVEIMRAQMATFKAALEQFATRHRDDIRRNPEFRQQFHVMCANIGVDPLVSNKSGTWAEKLGLGEFYYALAITVLDACKYRQAYDGGLTELSSVHRYVSQRRGEAADPITEDDIVRAMEKLSILGGGIGVMNIGGKKFIRSLPAELSTDGNSLLELAAALGGFFSRKDVADKFDWSMARISDALAALAREGLILIDDPPETKGESIIEQRLYWCPAVGMSKAVEEFQRRQGLAVTGFSGMRSISDTNGVENITT